MSLIGREAEVALVLDRLRDRRLVTLVGPGGIGKTTVARAVADRCADDYGDGALLVDLTRVDDAAGVRESLAGQLGFASFRALLDAPGDHSALVVVDNCEHVLDEVADSVSELLAACQMPTVLATSRTALELPGEAVVPLGPLELPRSGLVESPAVQLFLERSRDAGAEVDGTEVVAELCRRLDGIPLAIELAAARTRSLTPAEVLDRLVEGLDVLDRPRRRGAPRHQSLRRTIDWSLDLLSPAEQEAFTRLGVFPGPFTAELADQVIGSTQASSRSSAAATQDLLDGLVAASVLVADTTGPTTWYRMLETVRAHALDRLEEQGERHGAEARFVDHVVARVGAIIEQGAANWSATALGDLLSLYDNIASAIRWCLRHDDEPDRGALLVAVLWAVIHQAHTEDVSGLAEQALERWGDTGHPLLGDVAATAATCRYMLGDLDGAVALAEAWLEPAEVSPFAPATLRRALAQAVRASGDAGAAMDWFTAASAEAHRLGLVAMAAEADSARAQILADVGRTTEALDLLASVQDEARAVGSEVAQAWARAIEGSVRLRVDPDAAVELLEQVLAECRAIDYHAGTTVVLRSLALAELCRGDQAAAAARIIELLDTLLGMGATSELRMVLDVTSALLARTGRPGPAADLAATALTLPVVSITASVGHELFPPDPAGGRVLGVREAILATRAELEAHLAAGAVPSRSVVMGDRVGVFRRAGEYWEVGYGGELATVKASKGMDDLAALLAAPGRELHCLELSGRPVEEHGTGEVLDAAARRAYEDRVRELQADLEDAEADHDTGRAERARAELDAVVDQLTAALGLGGRDRVQGASAERARSAVTQRIRSTIRRVGAVNPELGRHLGASVRTGTFCSYEPEVPVRWQL